MWDFWSKHDLHVHWELPASSFFCPDFWPDLLKWLCRENQSLYTTEIWHTFQCDNKEQLLKFSRRYVDKCDNYLWRHDQYHNWELPANSYICPDFCPEFLKWLFWENPSKYSTEILHTFHWHNKQQPLKILWRYPGECDFCDRNMTYMLIGSYQRASISARISGRIY